MTNAVTVSLALVLAGAVFAAGAQQPGSKSRGLDPATGRVLNGAIEALKEERYDDSVAALDGLKRSTLSTYELARVEQILFEVAFARERYDEARRHLQIAIDSGGLTHAEIGRASYQLAQVLATEGRWQEGAEALEQWIAAEPAPGPNAYYLLAVAYYQMGDFDRALAPAREAVARMTEPREGWLGMVVALELKREAYANAVPLLQRLIQLAPEKKTYWQQLSSVYGQLEDYSGALAMLQTAYDRGLLTESAEILRLADLLLFNDQPRRCAQVLERAIGSRQIEADAAANEKLATCRMRAVEVSDPPQPVKSAGAVAATF